jgi:hypothetical protein
MTCRATFTSKSPQRRTRANWSRMLKIYTRKRSDMRTSYNRNTPPPKAHILTFCLSWSLDISDNSWRQELKISNDSTGCRDATQPTRPTTHASRCQPFTDGVTKPSYAAVVVYSSTNTHINNKDLNLQSAIQLVGQLFGQLVVSCIYKDFTAERAVGRSCWRIRMDTFRTEKYTVFYVELWYVFLNSTKFINER